MPPTSAAHLRAHDYRYLIERWRVVAKRAGIPLRRLVRADGYDLYALVTPALSLPNGPGLTAAIPKTLPPCEVQPRSQARSEVQLRNEGENEEPRLERSERSRASEPSRRRGCERPRATTDTKNQDSSGARGLAVASPQGASGGEQQLIPFGVYVSAGIHGDEPASTEGLLAWAEAQSPGRFRKLPLLLLPCLNPWGLVNNRRCTETGLDLNRSFHLEKTLPIIGAVKALVAREMNRTRTGDRTGEPPRPRPRSFAASLMLHEDYDGQGVYLYEVARSNRGVNNRKDTTCPWGEALLTAARAHLPTDPRPKIDGRKVAAGVHRRRIDFKRFAKIGYPEAIWLHLEHSERTFTVETPSEFAIEQRVAAQVAMIEKTIENATA